jgi:hypothetical protein
MLLEGEEDTLLPKASPATIKYFELSAIFPGPMNSRLINSWVVPASQVGNSTALDLSEFKTPKVR